MGWKVNSLRLALKMGAEVFALGVVRVGEKLGGKYVESGTKGLEERLVHAILHDADAMIEIGGKEFIPSQVSLINRAREIAHELTGSSTTTGALLGIINLYTDVDTLVDGIVYQNKSKIETSIPTRLAATCTSAVLKHVLRFFSQFASLQSLNMSTQSVLGMQAKRAEAYSIFDQSVIQEFTKESKATHDFHEAYSALAPDIQAKAQELLGKILVNQVGDDIAALEDLLANGQVLDTKSMNALETYIKERCEERNKLDTTLSPALLEAKFGKLNPQNIQRINDILGSIFGEFSEQIVAKHAGRFLFQSPFNKTVQSILQATLKETLEKDPRLKKDAEDLVNRSEFDSTEEAAFFILSRRDHDKATDLLSAINTNMQTVIESQLPSQYQPFAAEFQTACNIYINHLFNGTLSTSDSGEKVFSASSLKSETLYTIIEIVTKDKNKDAMYTAFQNANPELITLIKNLFQTNNTNPLGAIEITALASLIQLVPDAGIGGVMNIVENIIDGLITNMPLMQPLRGFILGIVRTIIQHVIVADPRYQFDITQREPEKIRELATNLEAFLDIFVKDITTSSSTIQEYDKSLTLIQAFFASPTLTGSILRLVSSLYRQDPNGTPMVMDNILSEVLTTKLPNALADLKPMIIGFVLNLFRGIFENTNTYDTNAMFDPNVQVDQKQLETVGLAIQEAVDQIKCNILGDTYLNTLTSFLVNTALWSDNTSEAALSALKSASSEDIDAAFKLIFDGVFHNPNLAYLTPMRPQVESLMRNLINRLVLENDQIQPSTTAQVAIPAVKWLQTAVANVTNTFRSSSAIASTDPIPLQNTPYRVQHTPINEREVVNEASSAAVTEPVISQAIHLIRAYEAVLGAKKNLTADHKLMQTYEATLRKFKTGNSHNLTQLVSLADPRNDILQSEATLYFNVRKDTNGTPSAMTVIKHVHQNTNITDPKTLTKAQDQLAVQVEKKPYECTSRVSYWTLGMFGGSSMPIQEHFLETNASIAFNSPGNKPTTLGNLNALLQACKYDYNVAYQVTRYVDTWFQAANVMLPEAHKVDELMAYKQGNQLLYFSPSSNPPEKSVSIEPTAQGDLKVTIKYRQPLIGISSTDEPIRPFPLDKVGPKYIEVEYSMIIQPQTPQESLNADHTKLEDKLQTQLIPNACTMNMHIAEGVTLSDNDFSIT